MPVPLPSPSPFVACKATTRVAAAAVKPGAVGNVLLWAGAAVKPDAVGSLLPWAGVVGKVLP